MALMDFLTKQFIDIIEWVDDSCDTLSFRFPDEETLAGFNGAPRLERRYWLFCLCRGRGRRRGRG